MIDTSEISVPRYHVQATAMAVKNGFPVFGHHESVSKLWSEKWRPACAAGIYPFTDADVEDFDPIFAQLVQLSDDDPAILDRPDEYAEVFLPAADRLAATGRQLHADHVLPAARDLLLRAAAVYRIARFPINRSVLTQRAWERGRESYDLGGLLLDPPSVGVSLPFAHADPARGDALAPVPAYLRMPAGDAPRAGWPVLLFICGLDAYRTDHTPRTQAHVDRGFATLSFEIPGTGDCPAAPGDPESPDRLMSSVVQWVTAQADTYGFDSRRIIARGVSTGGYYAFRAAHTHADQLIAAVAQGGGAHHMFDPAWIRAQNQMEYPFALADALAYKFGYRDDDLTVAVERYAAEAQRFSLRDSRIIGRLSCRLLAVNGMEDSIFPAEDSVLVAEAGSHRDLILRADRGHMGNPGAEDLVYRWIDTVISEAK